jgi:hypothetical protein
MVTFFPGRGVVSLVKVALKVTSWLTAGVVLEAVRVRLVGGSNVGGVGVGVGVGVGGAAVTLTVAVGLIALA